MVELPAVDLSPYVEAFLSIFVAMNVLGVLPLFMGLTDGMTLSTRRALVKRATTTAFAIAVVILLAGQFIFQTLGITVDDLRIGGGLILLVLAITDLLFSNLTRQPGSSNGDVGADLAVVPLGTPLMVGPAAITAILVLQNSAGYLPTIVALIANLSISYLVFYFGPALIAMIGNGAARAFAKVATLFLAAIAIALIRTGIVNTIQAM
ncbi:MAG: MarC family protein [Longimonas sp.]|uniref:MarC family protein n=1 Tax=Longimonas sp. TaxID=2039626 RepID=UPI00334B4362